MLGTKRISVVFALASYLLATTAVHFLHDHSGCQHSRGEHSAGRAFCSSAHDHGDADEYGHGSEPADSHEKPAAPGHCEDSCLACQYLAVKSIPAAPVVLSERVEAVCQIEPPQPVFVSTERPLLFLSRAPPCV